MDIALPQREYPVIHLEGSRDCDDQRGGGEEKAKVGIHSTHVHVVCPDDKTEGTDNDNRPHHHAVTEDVFACMNADQSQTQSQSWERNDIHLGVTKEPEQVLEQKRIAADVICLVAHCHDGGHEESWSQKNI